MRQLALARFGGSQTRSDFSVSRRFGRRDNAGRSRRAHRRRAGLDHAVGPELEPGAGHRGAEGDEPPTIMVAEQSRRGHGAIEATEQERESDGDEGPADGHAQAAFSADRASAASIAAQVLAPAQPSMKHW